MCSVCRESHLKFKIFSTKRLKQQPSKLNWQRRMKSDGKMIATTKKKKWQYCLLTSERTNKSTYGNRDITHGYRSIEKAPRLPTQKMPRRFENGIQFVRWNLFDMMNIVFFLLSFASFVFISTSTRRWWNYAIDMVRLLVTIQVTHSLCLFGKLKGN